jgi:hypothetical protein
LLRNGLGPFQPFQNEVDCFHNRFQCTAIPDPPFQQGPIVSSRTRILLIRYASFLRHNVVRSTHHTAVTLRGFRLDLTRGPTAARALSPPGPGIVPGPRTPELRLHCQIFQAWKPLRWRRNQKRSVNVLWRLGRAKTYRRSETTCGIPAHRCPESTCIASLNRADGNVSKRLEPFRV